MDIIEKNELGSFFYGKDYLEIKRIKGSVNLREFISGMLLFEPKWITWLYKLRKVLVLLFGLSKEEVADNASLIKPDEIGFNPGDKVSVFSVVKAEEETFWVCESPKDNHLKAYLGVIREKTGEGESVFHVVTSIDYLNFTGPLYFNLIRPFHHLVVNRMMKSGVQYGK